LSFFKEVLKNNLDQLKSFQREEQIKQFSEKRLGLARLG
jgi:hypothetical protein